MAISNLILLVLFYWNFMNQMMGCTKIPNHCKADNLINGCSFPLEMNWPFEKLFSPACNIHDICYSCASKLNLTQANCDNVFLKTMKTICTTESNGRSIETLKFERFLIPKTIDYRPSPMPSSIPSQSLSTLGRRRRFILPLLELWNEFNGFNGFLDSCLSIAQLYFDAVSSFGYANFVQSSEYMSPCIDSCLNKSKIILRKHFNII